MLSKEMLDALKKRRTNTQSESWSPANTRCPMVSYTRRFLHQKISMVKYRATLSERDTRNERRSHSRLGDPGGKMNGATECSTVSNEERQTLPSDSRPRARSRSARTWKEAPPRPYMHRSRSTSRPAPCAQAVGRESDRRLPCRTSRRQDLARKR